MTPYEVGVYFAKRAMLDRPIQRNTYPGVPATTPMDETATGTYDVLRDFIKQRKLEQGFDSFDRNTGIGGDNRTDLCSTPVSDGGGP